MTVSPIPKLPAPRGYESSGHAKLTPRYEDVTQDGRMHLTSLMVGMTTVWRTLEHGERLRAMVQKGIFPILSRVIMIGEEGPFSAHVPIHVEGTWRLAKERGGERLFLDMWLDAYAAHAQTHGPQPSDDAERALVGRMYTEHVVTRPFATKASERKVTRLEGIPGIPELPEDEHAYEDAPSLVAGASLEPAREHVFAMQHTDPNQHVNSLVYPRLFEEAATTRAIERRLTATPERLLARAIELRYRKPFFTGDRAVIAAAITPGPAPTPGALHAVGAFVPASPEPPSPPLPSTTVAMLLR